MKKDETILTGREIMEMMKNFPSHEGSWEKFSEMIKKQNKLYEGLIKSYPSHALKQKIEKDIKNSIVNIERTNGGEALTLYLPKENLNTYFDILKNILQVYGWKINYPKDGDDLIYQEINGIIYNKFLLGAIYDVDTSESIYHANGNNKPIKLYHITPEINLNSILTRGLIAKSKSKMEYHPERIYFLKDISNKHLIKNFISELFIRNDQNINLKKVYVILEIDLDKMKNDLRIKFLNDPNMDGAVYTMENIHPRAIKPIEKAEMIFQNKDNFTVNLTPIS